MANLDEYLSSKFPKAGEAPAPDPTGELRGTYMQVQQHDPDVYAKAAKMAADRSMPVDAVLNNLPTLEKQAEVDAVDASKLSPGLVDWLKQRDNLAVARDDIGVLDMIAGGYKAARGGVTEGLEQTELGDLAFKKLIGSATADDLTRIGQLEATLQARQRDAVATGVSGSTVMTALREAGKMGPQIFYGGEAAVVGAGVAGGVGAAGGALAGSVVPGWGTLAGAVGGATAAAPTGGRAGAAYYSFRQEAGFALLDLEKVTDEQGRPMDPSIARIAAYAVGGVNAGLETFGLSLILKTLPGGDKIMGKFTTGAVKEALKQRTVREALTQVAKKYGTAVGGEALTEMVQEAVGILGREIAQAASPGTYAPDSLQKDIAQVAQAGKSALLGTAVISGVGSSMRAVTEVQQAQKAQETRQTLQTMADAATSSKLRERLPEKFREYAARVQQGEPTENLYFQKEEFDRAAQELGADPRALYGSIVGDTTGYDESVATGGHVVMPTADYLSKVAGTSIHDKLADDAKFSPDDLSVREAKSQGGEMQAVQEMADKIRAGDTEGMDPETRKVYDHFYGQIEGGNYDRKAAEDQASLATAMVMRLAQRSGKSVDEIINRYGLDVRSTMPRVLSQRPEQLDTQLYPMLERLRAGDIPSERDAMGPTLLDFIREKGGLQDLGGELAARDMALWDKENRKPGQTSIMGPNGRSLDAMAEAATEAGYLPERDPNLLLDMIDNELRGKPVFAANNLNDQVMAMREALLALDEHFGKAGIDLKATGNEAIRQFIETGKLPEAPTQAPAGERLDQVDIESPEFKAWSEGAPVVGVNDKTSRAFKTGRPVVVEGLHATSANFTEFDPGMARWGGMFFSKKATVPNEIASFSGDGANIMPVYIRMSNPLVVNTKGIDPTEYADGTDHDDIGIAERGGHDGVIYYDAKTQDALYVAFSGEQIKSKFNRGTWDQNDPNILHQAGHRYTKAELDYLLSAGLLTDAEYQRMIGAVIAPEGQNDATRAPGTDRQGKQQAPSVERTGREQDGQRTVAGRPPAAGWGKATAVRTGRGPAFVYRGADRRLTPESFLLENLGKASGKNAAGLGVFFTPAEHEAAVHGQVQRVMLDIRNPFVIKVQDMPAFDSVEEAYQFSRDLEAKGYDGVAIDMRDVIKRGETGPVHFVAFKPEQVIEADRAERLNQSVQRSAAQIMADGALKAARGDVEKAIKEIDDSIAKLKANKPVWVDDETYDKWIAEREEARRLIASGESGYQKPDTATQDNVEWEPDEQLIAAAKKVFGATSDPKEAGYVLPDGTMLDFTGRHYTDRKDWAYMRGQRSVDHRELQSENTHNGKSLAGLLKNSGSEGMYEFMARTGAMRMDAASGVASISRPPTAKQIATIGNARKGDYLALSFNRPDGEIVMDGEFESANPQKVRKFFEDAQQQTGGTGVLAQSRDQGSRGYIEIAPNRRLSITLLANANMSTFQHEMAHAYLEMLRDLVNEPTATEQLKADWQTIREWLGIEGDKITVDQHERFARGWEAYLMEGNVPSITLARAFARMKSWMTNIYRQLRALNVTINDDVRGVFDRMVAAEDEIKAARQAQGYAALFADAEAMGVSQREFEAYQRAVADDLQAGVDRLQRDVMDELARERRQWWLEERDRVRGEVEAEVNADPGYQALSFIRRKGGTKLDRKALADEFGEAFIKTLPHGLYTKEGGASPASVAALFEFESPAKLLEALVRADSRPRDEFIKAETDRRMKEAHGDMLNDGSLPDRATVRIHNEKRADVLAMELRALRKGQMVTARVFREAARLAVSKKSLRSIRPYDYLLSERRAAQQSILEFAKGDIAKAAAWKERELVSHYMYLEATKAKQEGEKILEHVRKQMKVKRQQWLGKAGGDYLEQMNALLDQYEFRAVSGREVRRREGLAAWAARKAAEGTPIDVPREVLARAGLVNYADVQMAELRGVHDMMVQIEHLAGLKNKLRIRNEEREFGEVLGEVVQSIRTNNKQRLTGQFAEESGLDAVRRHGRSVLSIVLQPGVLARGLDGGDRKGPLSKYVVDPVAEAETQFLVRRREEGDKVAKILDTYTPDERKRMGTERLEVPGFPQGEGPTKWQAISLALNWGNEGNRAAILESRDPNGATLWDEGRVRAVLDTLDERDWQFVQDVWAYVNSFWPEISEAQKRRTGLSPKKVDGVPVATKFGVIQGAYYPLKYEPRGSWAVTADEAATAFDAMRAGRTAHAYTPNGHTKERVGSGGRPVRLDISVLAVHLDNVLRDLEMADAVNSAWRVLHDREVLSALAASDNMEAITGFELWLQDTAAGEIVSGNSIMTGLRRVRTGFTAAVMLFNVSNAMLNLAGIGQSAVVVGKGYMAKAAARMMRGPLFGDDSVIKQVQELSPMMRVRLDTFNKDVNDHLRSLEGRGDWREKMIRWGYAPSMATQILVDTTTWLGAYERAKAEGLEGDAAVQFADRLTEEAQSSGRFGFRSSFERGTVDRNVRQTELARVWTALLSYMLNKANRAYERTAATDFKSPGQVVSWVSDMVILYAVEAILYGMVRGTMPDDDDPEDLLAWAGKETVKSFLGSLPFVREAAAATQGFSGGGVVGSFADSIGRAYQQLSQGEVDASLVKSVNMVGGVLFGYPAAQVNKFVSALAAAESGKDVPVWQYVTGVPAK